MKLLKPFLLLLVAVLLQLPLATNTQAMPLAGSYPLYLNGDQNWICVDGHMGTAQYLNITSVRVDKYQPPYYVITAETAFASFDQGSLVPQNISKSWTSVDYNYRYRTIYVHGDNQTISDPDDAAYITRYKVNVAQAMFWVAYHMNFFPTSSYGNNYLPENDSRFY